MDWPATSNTIYPHLVRLAPEGWKRDHPPERSLRIGPPEEPKPELSVSAKQSRVAWARLIKKVHEADPPTCSRCHRPMKAIAVITDPAQVLKILRHLIETGKPPPVWIPPPWTDLPSASPRAVVCPPARGARAPVGIRCSPYREPTPVPTISLFPGPSCCCPRLVPSVDG